MHIHEVDTTNLVAFKRSVIYHGQQPMRLVNVHYNHLISGILNIPFTSTRSNTHTHTYTNQKERWEQFFFFSFPPYVCVQMDTFANWLEHIEQISVGHQSQVAILRSENRRIFDDISFFSTWIFFFLLLTQFLYNVQFTLVDFFVIAKKPQSIAGRM